MTFEHLDSIHEQPVKLIFIVWQLDGFENSLLVAVLVILDEESNDGASDGPLAQFPESELSDRRMRVLRQNCKGPAPHLVIGVLRPSNQFFIKAWDFSVGENFQIPRDDRRGLGYEKAFEYRQQILGAGVHAPSAEVREAAFVGLGSSNYLGERYSSHSFSVRRLSTSP
jgi:hypothetical protein